MVGPGDSIDRYVIEAVIGEGGMGRVFRALDPRLGRRVALKLMLAEGSDAVRSSAGARLMREARAAAAFSHPNVVAIHDVGEVSGNPYITMELVNGSTLRALAHDAPLPQTQTLVWLLDVARGLAAAHRAGLVHRDIKPDNVMVTTDRVVKILDFGIARRADTGPSDPCEADGHAPTAAAALPSLTAEGQIIGTPQYMAPEQLRGEPLDGRCDQFAWGVMAWELLAGRSPWGSPTNGAQLVTAVLTSEPPRLRDLLPDVPVVVEDAVARALAKSRDARFATMDDLVAVLEERTASPALASVPSAAFAATTPASVSAVALSADRSRGASAVPVTVTERTPLAIAETVFWLACGVAGVFGVGYASGVRGLEVAHLGGYQNACAMIVIYAVAGLFLLRGSPVRWLPVAACAVGSLGTYLGGTRVLAHLAAHALDASAAQRFRILHAGLFEAHTCRFIAFGLATALLVASLRLAPPARTREEALRRAATGAFAYGCLALSVLTRLAASADEMWSLRTLSRSERVAEIVSAAKAFDHTTLGLTAAALGLGALGFAWGRRLPGEVTFRGVLGPPNTWAALAVVVVLGVDALLSSRLRARASEVYAEIAPQLALFGNLEPATTTRDLSPPPNAPTLKLSRQKVAIGSAPVGLVSALDDGGLDAVLVAELSRRLAESAVPVTPPLLVMADQATTAKTFTAGLRVALEAGVSNVGIVCARGAPPLFRPDDPPEAA
jgi:hypothetical protein